MSLIRVHRPMVKFGMRRWPALAVLGMLVSAPASASDFTYLRSLLDAAPEGGWVKASVGSFSDAWVTGADGLPDQSSTNPGNIVHAWSSFAWDSTRGNLLLWGGGHANYIGNEMYIWQGATGAWTRGSLPSRIKQSGVNPATWLVVDDAAPQSAHTYDGNTYLPINDMFLTFGGAAFNTGGSFQVSGSDGSLGPAGPWLWDPRKADPNKVGGTTGSGYNLSRTGGEMWVNRQGQWTGDEDIRTYVQNTAAYREENKHDVVYVTKQRAASGWPSLYRYTLGDVRAGELDTWEKIGVSANQPAKQSAAVIDDANSLYVQTSYVANRPYELHVWDLTKSNPANPRANLDIGIDLVELDGTPFVMSALFGIAYDEVDGSLLLWDGEDFGTVWETQAAYDSEGNLETTWAINEIFSSTAEQPNGSFARGVLGKWDYISELDAFVALNEFDSATKDAAVWLYKPLVSAVPEPGLSMWIAGLSLIVFSGCRRTRTT